MPWRYWSTVLDSGKTRLQDLLDRYGITEDQELPMGWNLIHSLTPIPPGGATP
jgi:hypothetical protein